MNNTGPANEEPRDISVFLERQQRILKAVKEELHASHEKLKQTLRQHDDIFYRLFPPVAPGRDATLIGSSIEDSRKQLARLRQAIFNQRLELESLLQSSSTSTSPAGVEPQSLSDQHSLPSQMDESERETIIANGRSNLARLKKEFADTRLNLDKLEALLSPIRLLPVEVLGEIFSYCSENRTDEPMSLFSGPLLVTHVCSSWRHIALNEPGLWTNVWVRIENDDFTKEGWPALVKLWIERSKELSLSFHLQETETHNYVLRPQSVFFRVLDILATQSHRWKNAELINRNIQSVSEIEWFRNIPQQSVFPLLESFQLQTRKMGTDEASRLTEMMRSSPRLRSIHWMIKTSSRIPVLPWAQLTNLTLIFIITLDEALDIMSQSPHLRSLDASVELSPALTHSREITHQNLQKLYISYSGKPELMFNSITLPKVRDLTVDQMRATEADDANDTWPHNAFMTFLRRSKCALHRLAMMEIVINQDDQLLALLRHLSPSLHTLDIDNFDQPFIKDNVLKSLTYPENTEATASSSEHNSGILCPNLQELKLWGCVDSTDGVLASMVESRWYWPKDHPSIKKLRKGDFAAQSPPERPLDQQRITKLHSLHFKYSTMESYV